MSKLKLQLAGESSNFKTMKKQEEESKNNQKGVALLLAVVILSVVLLGAIFIVNNVITQLKLAGDINDSVAAIYAADAGAECQLYNLRQGASINCYTGGNGQIIMSNGANVSTTITGSSPNFTIKSLGSYREVKRQFEVSF